MIPFDSGVKVWLATGHTDMRRGFPGLALQVQEILKQDSILWASVLLSRPEKQSFESDLARRPGQLHVYKKARARAVHLA